MRTEGCKLFWTVSSCFGPLYDVTWSGFSMALAKLILNLLKNNFWLQFLDIKEVGKSIDLIFSLTIFDFVKCYIETR